MEVDYLEHWYTALHSEVGFKLAVVEGDREQVRQKLYAARAASGDPSLSTLGIILPKDLNEIWIVKKEIEVAAPQE